MAKLGACYGLCPLIDQRNLLGVNEDYESGHVIVTLGKNIAIKYRLSDQKQTHSWRTKDKFSSPVIYDKEANQYVAVFNQIYVRVWKSDEEYSDKLKKYKFCRQIYTLISCNNTSFVIFKNGTILLLNFAIKNRKELNFDDVENKDINLEVLNVAVKNDIYVGVLSKCKEKMYFSWKVFNGKDESEYKILISKRENLTLLGQVLCQISYQQNVHLLTLWSDGKLYSHSLNISVEDATTGTESQGNVFAMVESLSHQYPVTMVHLSHNYIAMYGADSNEEGASLILYNTQFKVSQSKQSLKLFTSGAKLWRLENNLLICIGQNLAVMPFYLDKEQLAALLGSHVAILNDPDVAIIEEMEIVNWTDCTSQDNIEELVPKKIQKDVLELLKQGLSEATICEEVLPKYIENKNIQAISSCLIYFCDIPELYVAKLLYFCLNVDLKYFKDTETIISTSLPKNLQSLERCMLLDKVLMIPSSDILLLSHIQNELDLDNVFLLLQYICYLMSEEGHSLHLTNITDSENRLIRWGCLLLDANYQKLILSKDQKIVKLLVHYSKIVNDYLICLENLQKVVPLLMEVKQKKGINRNKQIANLKYSIEQLSLY